MHTPGPWFTHGKKIYPGVFEEAWKLPNWESLPRIGMAMSGHSPDGSAYISPTEGDDNARLIAAAPDLLAVVTAVLDQEERCDCGYSDFPSLPNASLCLRCLALTAYNKAVGKE